MKRKKERKKERRGVKQEKRYSKNCELKNIIVLLSSRSRESSAQSFSSGPFRFGQEKQESARKSKKTR